MLEDWIIVKKRLLISNSEWRVKVVGNQSCMRLGEQLRDKTPPEFAGARSIGVATWCSDLSPHWSNMVED